MSNKLVKVVLQKSVRGCGTYAQIVGVRPGYARHLVREGMAMIATEERIKETDARRGDLQLEDEKTQAQATADAEILDRSRISFVCAAGGHGRLYGSVAVGDVVARIKEQLGLVVPKNAVSMSPIRATGEHQVRVYLNRDIQATLRVVVAESEEARTALLKQTPKQADQIQ